MRHQAESKPETQSAASRQAAEGRVPTRDIQRLQAQIPAPACQVPNVFGDPAAIKPGRDQIAYKETREIGIVGKRVHQLFCVDLAAGPHSLRKGTTAQM